jgi:hypothetical protein
MALTRREIYERALPATLLLVIVEPTGPNSIGSGVVIRADGLAVTNFHVVENVLDKPASILCFLPPPGDAAIADDVGAFLKQHGGRPINCRVGRVSRERDLAILHLEKRLRGYAFVPMGDSNAVRAGDEVVCIGSPNGLVWTMSDGTVSARRENTLQITAPISGGNSGGPLLNAAGELIGVNSFIHTTGQNLNFARPIALVRALLEGPEPPPVKPGPAPTPAPAPAPPTRPTVPDEPPDRWTSVLVRSPPRGVESWSCQRQTREGTTRQRVTLAFDPAVLGGTRLLDGATAAVVLEDTATTRTSWWSLRRIGAPLSAMVRTATQAGLPGVHAWLSGTRARPVRYAGLLRTPADVAALVTRTASVPPVTERLARPAVAAALDELTGTDTNLALAVFGERPFEDEASTNELLASQLRKNTAAAPHRLGLALRTVGPRPPGPAPAGVGWGASPDLPTFAMAFGDLLTTALVIVGSDGVFEAKGRVKRITDLATGRESDGARLTCHETVPRQVCIELVAETGWELEGVRELSVAFTSLDGRLYRARLGW